MPPPPAGATLASVLDAWAAADPSHPAIFHEDRVISYAELQVLSLLAARALLARGV